MSLGIKVYVLTMTEAIYDCGFSFTPDVTWS